mmetsp:Transcript_18017/g.41301  ORF Transcript_18017/g.41301 Transcript_18017/m.41301 type:complete len:212 (-) Transcript_18017:68-703(-)
MQVRRWPMEGTLLARREHLLLPLCYPNVTRVVLHSHQAAGGGGGQAIEQGEDYICVQRLIGSGQLAQMHAPHLYVYTVHGNNTCNEAHFLRMVQGAYRLPAAHRRAVRPRKLRALTRKRYDTLVRATEMLTKEARRQWTSPQGRPLPPLGRLPLAESIRAIDGLWLSPQALCEDSNESTPFTRALLKGAHKKKSKAKQSTRHAPHLSPRAL